MPPGPQQKAKLPLKLRLKAWWEGYDEYEFGRAMGFLDNREGQSGPKEPLDIAPEGESESGLIVDPWDEQRIDIAQYIWGKGYCGPGGTEFIISTSKLLTLSPEYSMLNIGAGLGGPARTLSDKFGVYVSGYERSQKLVNAGNELCKRAGLSGKVELFPYDPAEVEEFDRKFDRVFIKDELFTIPEKNRLIPLLFEWLKPEGLLLTIDFVVKDESVLSSTAFREWADGEPRRPSPYTHDGLVKSMEDAGLSVRVDEDISDQYSKMISDAWRGADKVVAKLMAENNGQSLVETLLKEAEFWSRRAKLLASGDLMAVRVLGYKTEKKKRMLSDW